MSLLSLIKSKKTLLKKTETTVTQPDGKIFKESREGDPEIIGHTTGFVVDTKPDKIPAKVIENVYLGSQDCCDLEVLQTFDIKAVLSLGVDAPEKYPDITYKYIECLDLPETNLNNILEQSVPFINSCLNNKHNVLVHCNAGVSRSPAVVIGFLILRKGYTYSEAFELCKTARSCVRPNDSFERQLKMMKF